MTLTSTYPDIDIPAGSIYDALFGELTPDERERVAITDGVSGASVTYGELVNQIDGVAGALASRGIGVGDVVALHSPNVPAFVAVFHGILRSGATVTTVNSLYTADEIAAQLTDSGATTLMTVTPLAEGALEAAAAVGIGDDDIIVLDGDGEHTSMRDLLALGQPAPEVSFDPATHLAVLPYSSGTTGRAKGVMLTHRNLVANVEQSLRLIRVEPDDVVLAVLPFFHIYGMTVLLNLSVRQRARLVTMPRFDLTDFLRNVQDERITYAFIAPPIAVALAKHPIIDDYDLSSLRVVLSGAAPLDADLGNAVHDRLGCRVLQGYGMTEMSPVSHVIPYDRPDISIGSIGLAVPNLEYRVADPVTGDDVLIPASGPSESGELLCRGPNIMAGYLGNDEATAQALDDDGFLHTGDLATVDSDGVVHIVDRLKELIKYKGYQVAPAELEALLLTHPAITDAAVVPHPDESVGEVPKAFVVKGDASLTENQVVEFVAENVAAHKKVRLVEFIDAIPKSASGKILRKELRAPTLRR